MHTYPFYDVVIRRARDGVERTYRMDVPWEEGEDRDLLFWWEDGNGGCDCNRGDFFDRAGGASEDDIDATIRPCGNSAYIVTRFIFPDGRILEHDES